MRKKIRRTGKNKAVAAISLAMLLGMTGCAGKEAAPEKVQEGGYDTDAPSLQESEKEELDPVQNADSPDAATDAVNKPEEESHTVTVSQETEHLGGKVQEPQAAGMTFAQTTLVDEEGMVTLLDMKDAKKIPVKFTEDTKVEHWTIQGGGAGIDMQDAAISDLKEGMGVELEGYFEGDTFVATKVIIEDYV